jgi:hypothetical protein
VAVEGGLSWYAANQVVTAKAVPVNATYAFMSWAGGPVTPAAGTVPPGGASGTLVMDGPKALTADFRKPLVAYTVTSMPVGLQVIVDGNTYTTPKVFNWLPGETHTIGVMSPQSGIAGTQYIYQGWSDQGAQSHAVTVPQSASTYTVAFGTVIKERTPRTQRIRNTVMAINLLLLSEENSDSDYYTGN